MKINTDRNSLEKIFVPAPISYELSKLLEGVILEFPASSTPIPGTEYGDALVLEDTENWYDGNETPELLKNSKVVVLYRPESNAEFKNRQRYNNAFNKKMAELAAQREMEAARRAEELKKTQSGSLSVDKEFERKMLAQLLAKYPDGVVK